VIDNAIDHREIDDKSDDLHRATALGTLEGIARRLVVFIPQAQKAPDYTTFQVRSMRLGFSLEVYGEAKEYDMAGDASGLKPTNRGEYRISHYGVKRKKFVKLHLAVNTKTKQVV